MHTQKTAAEKDCTGAVGNPEGFDLVPWVVLRSFHKQMGHQTRKERWEQLRQKFRGEVGRAFDLP